MRHLSVSINHYFRKGVALILLSVLTVFLFTFNFIFFFYRLVAMTFAAVGTAITVVDCYKYGFTTDRGIAFLILLAMVALRFLLPLLARTIEHWNEGLKDYVLVPLNNKPSARYTI